MDNAVSPCGFDRFSKWAFLGLFAEYANTHDATAFLLRQIAPGSFGPNLKL